MLTCLVSRSLIRVSEVLHNFFILTYEKYIKKYQLNIIFQVKNIFKKYNPKEIVSIKTQVFQPGLK
jgi:hypothetical protein